jgi:hypothetical protein
VRLNRAAGALLRSFLPVVEALTSVACGSSDNPAAPVARELGLNLSEIDLDQRDSVQLLYTVRDAKKALVAGVTATFTSDNPSIVTVSATGIVKSVGPAGSASIHVAAASLERTVPVMVRSVADRIVVTPTDFTVPQKGTQQLTAQLLDRAGVPVPNAAITYESNVPALASVSATGLVTSLGPSGTLSIILRVGQITATVNVTIAPVAARVDVLNAPFKVLVGGKRQLLTRVVDVIGSEIPNAVRTFVSSDSALVAVAADGTVTSVGDAGEATITVGVQGSNVTAAVPVSVVASGHPDGIASTIAIPGGSYGVAFISETEAYASNAGNNVFRLDLVAGTATPIPGSHGGLALAASPQLNQVISANGSTLEFIRAGPQPAVIATLQLPAPALDIVISPNGRVAWVSMSNKQIDLIDITTRLVATSTIGVSLSHFVFDSFYPNIVYGTLGFGDIYVVDLDQRQYYTFTTSDPIYAQSVAATSDGSYLYVASEYGTIEEFDLFFLEPSRRFPTCDAWGLRISSDDAQLYVTCSNGQAVIIDREEGTILKTFASGGSRGVAVSPDGFLVLFGGSANGVTVVR